MIVSSVSYSQTQTTRASNLSFSVQGGVQIPTGTFGDVASTGFGFSVTGEYVSSDVLSWTGSVGWSTFGEKSVLYSGYDYSLSIVPIVVGLRYYLARGDFHTYVGAEAGLYISSVETTIVTPIGTSTGTASDTDFGFAPLVGFKYHLSPTIDLDGTLKYHLISSTNYLGINAGVQFGL